MSGTPGELDFGSVIIASRVLSDRDEEGLHHAAITLDVDLIELEATMQQEHEVGRRSTHRRQGRAVGQLIWAADIGGDRGEPRDWPHPGSNGKKLLKAVGSYGSGKGPRLPRADWASQR